MDRLAIWLFGVILAASVSSCINSERASYEKLRSIDESLSDHPGHSLDSLMAMDCSSFNKELTAYYNLLLTIARHKNRVLFSNDSVISLARNYYLSNTQDHYNQARASFYNGVVRQLASATDTLAYKYIIQARQIMDQYAIKDDRLSALVDAFLGQINYANGNWSEAEFYYEKAVENERRLGNARNMIIDICYLLVCQATLQKNERAGETLALLDSALVNHPDIHSENINNAKAIYYIYSAHQLDSAKHYCLLWKPSQIDFGAKQRLLSAVYDREGDYKAAIDCEKKAFENRRTTDTVYYHTYYNRLSSLYDKLGNRDSSLYYARIAYQSLLDTHSPKTEKRILELEKQFTLAAKEAELVKARHHQALLTLILLSALILIGFLSWSLYLNRRLRKAEQQTREKDAISRALLMSALSSYSGINQKLIYIHNLPTDKRQDALDLFIRDNQKTLAENIEEALSSYADNIPPTIKAFADRLGGIQQRAVFILTEMKFPAGDIAKMLSTTPAQVRSVKSAVRKQLQQIPLDSGQSIAQLEIMKKDSPSQPPKPQKVRSV